ncbi:hypothetical protein MTR_3g050030 [Medicago truncatula]|uniref:Putative plant transposon protein domain-containing protein n=1 Tax=Medicago truncatula TaxID=3880 RepID=G7J1D4_MEDTR|nr:hypothetical protein MTR_3g050030 [Medicago truncatula]
MSIDPFSCSPPKSSTTSAPIKVETFDELLNIKPKQSLSNEIRKSIRLSSKPSKVSYFDLEDETTTCIQDQNPHKRFKPSVTNFTPYDRKKAQKEKMLDEIVSEPINAQEKSLVNPYLENEVLESSTKRLLAESKSFSFEEIKKKEIPIDDVLKSIGWKEFCEIDEVFYPNLVQEFYSSATTLEGHDLIMCQINQTNIIIITDLLAKVFNIPNSGVKLYGRKWYDEAKPKLDRFSVLNELLYEIKPGKDFPVTTLKNEYKILHNICTHSLLPRSSCKYCVNDTDLMILHHLTHRKRVNLPYLIIQHKIHTISDTKGNSGLPYSMALTKIFKEFKLSFIGEVAKRNLKFFTSKNIAHIKLNNDPRALAIHQIPLPREPFLKEEEEENPLLSIVNAIIVEDHLSSKSATLNSRGSQSSPLYDLNVSTDLNLSTGVGNPPAPISSTPLLNYDSSALFGTTCLNRFIDFPKNDNPLQSEIPQIPSHFSSFGSFKSTGTSPKNDPPIETENPIFSNEMIFAELTSLQANVNNLRECFISVMYSYFGMIPPAPGFYASSSNPPPNDQ